MKNNHYRGCFPATVAAIIILTVLELWTAFFWFLVAVSALVALLLLRDFLIEKYHLWRARRKIRRVAKRHPENELLQEVKVMIDDLYKDTRL